MKTMLAILMFLSFGQAFAGQYVDYGKVHFQSAATWVKAENVCRSGAYLYHKKKDFVTVKYCNEGRANCKAVNKPLVQPVNSTRQMCTQYAGELCQNWATVSYNQGTTKAKVYRNSHDMDEDRNPVKTFSYTVDRCMSSY